jgi:nucleolar complex protein 3
LAIFQDIIPGYRIRALTDTEKAEKVSQMVQQTRDWEQGLVTIYQSYLRLLDAESKGELLIYIFMTADIYPFAVHSDLADVALRCMCTLLTEVTHFNFRVNVMTCIVTRLSKKSWDQVCPRLHAS